MPADAIAPRPALDRSAHIGVHAQKQADLNWIASCCGGQAHRRQMRALARIAGTLGDGDIRLTVWQNLLISGVPTASLRKRSTRSRRRTSPPAPPRSARPRRLQPQHRCRFAAADTKRHAEEIARWCEARVELDTPVNIHLTGCHHSCAQHYIGDIGLLACKVAASEDGDTVEGYHILVGGGFGPDAGLAREVLRDVQAQDAPAAIERLLRSYLAQRQSPQESVLAFTRRHTVEALRAMMELAAVA